MSWRRWVLWGAGGIAGLALLLAAGVASYGTYVLEASRPRESGALALPGLSAPVTITRDAEGVPTIRAATRLDLARALGFLHGQERFFQMDLLRRSSAGELAELVGPAALPIDRARRLHRFRMRAGRALAAQSPQARALLAAYTAGVNAGLAALGHAPFEYSLLRANPVPWRDEDTGLVVYAMYLDLQDSDGRAQALHDALIDRLGPQMAALLDPDRTPFDAPDDGSVAPSPVLPDHVPVPAACPPAATVPAREHGSNSFAVSGALTGTGAAMLANDMHLDLGVPNLWYRARQVLADRSLDLNGVTLPGTPMQVVGSNGHIAWGFTDSYIATGDLIRLDLLPPTMPGGPQRYATPDGPRDIETVHERLCALRAGCEDLPVRQTIWGPIQGAVAGAPAVWRWIAEDDDAIGFDGMAALESAGGARAALDAAHRTGLPQQNLLVADAAGHIGWTVIGRIPRRIGLGDRRPHSWADGTRGWTGRLAPDDIPQIVDPPSGRLWTANGRVVGGVALDRLGDGGYADGLRAGRIRDDLSARGRFAPADLLAIQTDDRAVALDDWQAMLLAALDRAGRPQDADLRAAVRDWGGHAVPDSVGYRAVHEWRALALSRIYGAWAGCAAPPGSRAPARDGWAIAAMLRGRPPGLVPPGFADWTALESTVLDALRTRIAQAGGLARFTWGAVNHVGIHHPLARAVPGLSRLTDPPDLPEAGDTMVPRVQITGFGASERLVVSPGWEGEGLLSMPSTQGGNPLSGYGDAAHEAWRLGRPYPLLPGRPVATLVLRPAG